MSQPAMDAAAAARLQALQMVSDSPYTRFPSLILVSNWHRRTWDLRDVNTSQLSTLPEQLEPGWKTLKRPGCPM